MIQTIIFDWKRTLYDPDQKILIKGATKLLKFIHKKVVCLVLVGKGGENMQTEVERLGADKYFNQITFAEGEKNPQFFIPFISNDDPKKTVFIGDRVRSELQIGKGLGTTTIWVRQGKFADEEPEDETQEPDYTVESLAGCLKLLQSLI